MPTITVALVDGHPLMVAGLVKLLSRSGGFQVVATGRSAQDILDICEVHEPQVIVVDLMMDGDVYKRIAEAIRIAPNTKIVTFTGAEGIEPAILALDAGATGYVSKGSTTGELVQAIESVHAGETYITQRFTGEVRARLRDAPFRRKAAKAVILSVRELRIMHLLMIGRTDNEIALALKINEATLKNHMSMLMRKLKLRNRREAVIEAEKHGRRLILH